MGLVNEVSSCAPEVARAYLEGASRDGYYNKTHRTFRICQRHPDWLGSLKILLGHLGRRSWIYREGRREVWVLETSFLCHESEPLRTIDEESAFARGFFDAEGGVPRDINARFYVQLVQRNLDDLRRLHSLLSRLGIECGTIHNPSRRVDPEYWRFYVLSRSHPAFASVVSSWHPVKRRLLDARFPPTLRVGA